MISPKTERQKWLVEGVISRIKTDQQAQNKLGEFLSHVNQTPMKLRGILRKHPSTFYMPKDSRGYLTSEDVNFVAAWLWVNELNLPADDYFVSANPATQKDLDKMKGDLMSTDTDIISDALLTLENEGELYQRTQMARDNGNFISFRSHVNHWVTSRFDTKERTPLTPDKRCEIFAELWYRQVGNVDAIRSHLPALPSHYTEVIKKYEPRDNAPDLSTTLKESEMNPTPNTLSIAFETRHYVYGHDIKNLSADQLIDAIKRVENEIETLKSVKTKSKHITGRIKELETMLNEIVAALDSKEL